MKKIIYLCLFMVLTAYYSSAQEVKWYTDMEKAAELSLKKKKPMLMFFTGSDWCGWCIKLQKEVLKTPGFEKWAKDNVILVELDFPRSKKQEEKLQAQNYQMQNIFQVRGYPTVVFATPQKTAEGKISLTHLGRTGYVQGGPEKWIEAANGIIKK